MRCCWSVEHQDGAVVAGNSRRFVGDVFEWPPKRQLFDVDDPDCIGRLGPDAGQNERAVVGVHPDVEADDEARCGEPAPSRRVCWAVAHAILCANTGARETQGSGSLSGIGGDGARIPPNASAIASASKKRASAFGGTRMLGVNSERPA
jgi:hypothetical protein